ncbi:MAG TPA: site-specific integrase [Cyclobacteriaceae bacterium]|nr:site-specific integrase [Cyclobacteriaceae bacterium]HRJ81700.1 site-specific integrase [Cyclobacteriaceae bacterium]
MKKVKSKVATPEPILWQWSENNEGKHPVKMRITFDRKRNYYPIQVEGKNLFLSESEWEELQDLKQKVRGDKKKTREAIAEALTLALSAIEKATSNNRPFTFERFEMEFLTQETKKGFLALFRKHLKDVQNEGRIGTYKAYKNAYSAFNKFRGAKYDKKGNEINPGKELSPTDLTPSMLKDFEAYMKKQGAGKTTIGIYMRSLKVVFNVAASDNPSLNEFYPFAIKQTDKARYKIKTGSGKKGDALTPEQLEKLAAIEVEPGTPEHESKLLWLFSFYCQGMNFKDIAGLKYRNIDLQNQVITYVRAKTQDTEAEEKPMQVPINEAIKNIITAIGNPDKKPDSFVFDIIPMGLTSTVMRRTNAPKTNQERLDEIVRQKIKMVNKRLKQLCESNELPAITTYWARHTYASLLKQAGESVELIRELLGHSDIRTTEAYLNRFDIGRKKEANDKIFSSLKIA